MGEPANFEVDDDQTTEPPVKEEQVDAIPLLPNSQPSLPGQKREVVAKLEEELLKLQD